MNNMKKSIWRILGIITGVVYYPIYLLFCMLHKLARFVLAVSYLGMLERKMAVDIFKSLFSFNGRIKI